MALTEAQRAELYAKIPSGGYDGSISSRARIVLLHVERHSVAEIAGMMDTSKVTVYKWIDRYHEGGLPALESRESTGRPREISGEVRSRILALSRQTPPGETGLSHWSSQEMARYLKKHEGIAVSHNFVAVLWRDLAPQQPEEPVIVDFLRQDLDHYFLRPAPSSLFSPSATRSSAPSSPGSAAPAWDANPAIWTRIDRRYQTLRAGMQDLFHDLGITATAAAA